MARKIDYMRISVTDRCNLRCRYCIPEEGLPQLPKTEIMTFNEIIRLAKIFSLLGGRKIRMTGGEPLLRKDLCHLIHTLSSIKGIEKVCLTTNGVLLPTLIHDLKSSGLNQINISVDSLKHNKFQSITGYDKLNDVLRGIEQLSAAGFSSTKINTVIIRSINDDEILDFIQFAIKYNFVLRFIEFMPVTPLWNEKYYFSIDKIREICESKYSLQRIPNDETNLAEYYSIGKTTVGFIKTDRDNCHQCNKIRVTPGGKLKVCLYEKEGIDLKTMMREGASNQTIAQTLQKKMGMKDSVQFDQWENSNIFMSTVGG